MTTTETQRFSAHEQAQLDDGAVWATWFAVTGWTETTRQTLTGLLRRAVD